MGPKKSAASLFVNWRNKSSACTRGGARLMGAAVAPWDHARQHASYAGAVNLYTDSI